jgi:two-component system, NtrC family, sensor histidine kinase HydH
MTPALDAPAPPPPPSTPSVRAAEDTQVGSTVKRLTWLTAARLVLYALLLAAVAALYLGGDTQAYPASLRLVVFTVGIAFAAAGVYSTWLRTGRALVALSWTQVVVDQLLWTALVYLSGGPLSGASAFYGLTCVLAAITLGAEGAIASAIIGGGLFIALVSGLASGLVKPPADQPAFAMRPSQYVYPSLVTFVALLVVAMLASYLARRLQAQSGMLVEVTERAERAERLAALGRIAAALAHEIRNPLGSILGSIDIIREAPGLGEDERRLCQIIRHETDRLNDLVSDMMNLARPRPPSFDTVDVARIAQDVVRIAGQAGRGEQDVAVVYEGPEHVTVRADAAQLRQVIWNLLRNAVQASGADASVRVCVEPRDKEVSIAVVDRGLGIPPAARDRIFDAFVTTRAQGVGIGLAVVRQIVDGHDAKIAVEDTPGGGTTFRVLLQAARAEETA